MQRRVWALTDAGENGTNWPVYFRLGAESYSSLGRVGKKEENSVSTFELFRLGTSFESAPVSVKLSAQLESRNKLLKYWSFSRR